MSLSLLVEEKINKYSELEIIDAQEIYARNFRNIPEQNFYKTISRMAKSGEIIRLAKNIYCKPAVGRFGQVLSSEKHILEYYLGSKGNRGVVVGYRMYNKYKLTTQISKGIEVYSNVSVQERKNVLNVKIKKVNLRFEPSTSKIIELLNVLENFNSIEELNRKNTILFIEGTITSYSDTILENLIKTISYKKSTLASLKSVLDYYTINHSIGNYLGEGSNYKSVRMEDLFEY